MPSRVEADAAAYTPIASARHTSVNDNRAVKFCLSTGNVQRVQSLEVRTTLLGFGDTVESPGGNINYRCTGDPYYLINVGKPTHLCDRNRDAKIGLPQRSRCAGIICIEGIDIIFHRGDVHHIVESLVNVHVWNI